MIKDPGYYRDLLNRILQEDEDDNIPAPPTRGQVKLQQIKRKLASSTLPFTVTLEDETIIFSADNLNIPISNDRHIESIGLYFHLYDDSGSAAIVVNPPYPDFRSHPYPNDSTAADIANKWLGQYGIDVDMDFSESGMQDKNYLHYDANITPESLELLRDILSASGAGNNV